MTSSALQVNLEKYYELMRGKTRTPGYLILTITQETSLHTFPSPFKLYNIISLHKKCYRSCLPFLKSTSIKVSLFKIYGYRSDANEVSIIHKRVSKGI